ncbi:MAG: ATP-dependent endonuclease [Nitrospirae bacterium]|nr:ATP-dependent endonuclease [Nitrospirota bacterium]
MRIKKITIDNFRSIKHIEINCEPLGIFIGQNNHGKSNIFLALQFFFESSFRVSDDDFFKHADTPNVLSVELQFFDLEEQDKTTFKKYLLPDQTIRILKTAKTAEDKKIESFYNGYINAPQEEWLVPDNASNYTNRDTLTSLPSEFINLLPPTGRLTKSHIEEAQLKYIEAYRDNLSFDVRIETGPFMGAKTFASGILGDFYLIPAVRDISDETKVQATTNFGKLLNNLIKEMSLNNPDFIEIKEKLSRLLSSLNVEGGKRPKELFELEKSLAQELKPWEVSLDIEITPPDIEKLFQLGTSIFVNDGIRTPIEMKGHGIQRSLIFALFKEWAKTIRKMREQTTDIGVKKSRYASQSTFFAIEEPELFLHPQAQRQIMVSLGELSNAPNHQVFLCTHSTWFVDMDLYRSITVVRKPSSEAGTLIAQCTKELFEGGERPDKKNRLKMAYWFNPDRSELFFARKVVLVEGETEKIIFPLLAQRIGCYDENVCIIDCGSKFNIPLYIEVLNAFGIQYFIAYDEDPMSDELIEKNKKGLLDEKEKSKFEAQQRCFAENKNIETLVSSPDKTWMLTPDFEKVFGISRSASDNKGKPLAAIEKINNVFDISSALEKNIRKMYELTL